VLFWDLMMGLRKIIKILIRIFGIPAEIQVYRVTTTPLAQHHTCCYPVNTVARDLIIEVKFQELIILKGLKHRWQCHLLFHLFMDIINVYCLAETVWLLTFIVYSMRESLQD
jgi:hypothetical protein